MPDRVEIFDTTLRDGEQSPGASMNVAEKLEMAAQLERLNVDTMEAGFPVASEQEFEGVRKVAAMITNCKVAALARAVKGDIECAARALEPAKKPVLHTFIATSDIHLEHKLRMTRQQVLDRTGEAVALAKSLVERVEFSAEDATRSDWDYLTEVVKTAISAGADVINLPDTVGYTTPGEIEEMFRYIIAKVNAPAHVVFSSHNHNDLGLAVANALAAVRGGARQVECTVNGIGERAGNTSLEEVVMAFKIRNNVYPYFTNVVTEEIYKSSRMLSNITGLVVPYNKPIVGRNAFAHEAGIHQHGVIASRITYEIMTPESVGRSRSELVLGKHSGKHGLAKKCEELGFKLTETELSTLYQKFIALADRKKEVFEDDLRVLIASMRDESFVTYHLEEVTTAGHNPAMAMVKLRKGDQEIIQTAIGDGPVDAACQALEEAIGFSGKLEEFHIRAATPGKDALGEAHVSVRIEGTLYNGTGASTDIIEAAVRAYLNALNKYLAIRSTK
ncbi:MAG TPA: 2-isopropylmalate synthase [Candidatus Hydrogenedentes bacterium]|nr:2-isopropylmalate synthase [Candidatus Hydrogenedentota bacterium]HOL75775.1 2-isopropylmalate synthase [Candidatus Hydrogenedentota bacterium]HPO84231.1 2-isopropylmalate synthase [Candidatus Hydrogenedentota bacterium]